MSRNPRSGFALIETLVAITVLGVSGLALAQTAAQAVRFLDRASAAESRMQDMDRLMAAYTLLDRRDLGRRVGLHQVGPYAIRVQRLGFDLFRIGIGETRGEAALVTTVYRRDARDD